MRHDLATSVSREGVLYATDSTITVITDKEIEEGDLIGFPACGNPFFNNSRSPMIVVKCDSILEQSPSRGQWKGAPPTYRKIKYTRQ